MKYVLDMRERSVGGAVVRGVLTNVDTGLSGPMAERELAMTKAVTFLIHGFNVNRPEGRRRMLELAEVVGKGNRHAFLVVLWPGDHGLGPLSYSFEGADARDTALELIRFIGLCILPGTSLSFVSHSLGARVVMETIEGLSTADYRVANVCLMAAAIDDFSLSSMRQYRTMVEHTRRVAVLSSRKDKVLEYAYPAGDLLQAFFFSDEEPGLALGYHGPRVSAHGEEVPANVLDQRIESSRDSRHGDYVPDSRAPLGTPRWRNRTSAADYARQVISDDDAPAYR